MENKQRVASSGAVAFFHKPINHDDLLKVVRATLEGPGNPA
jgi:FixJ family two-component response regulator